MAHLKKAQLNSEGGRVTIWADFLPLKVILHRILLYLSTQFHNEQA